MNITKLFRPSTLVSPAVGALLFQLLAIRQSGISLSDVVVVKLIVGIFILAMSNAAGNIINHVVDSYDTDAYHPTKRNRPIVSGQVDRMVAISMSVYIFGASLVLAFVVFGIVPGLLVALIMLMAWAYSAPPRLKKKFIVSNLSIGTPRGFLGVVTAYAFFAHPTIPVMAFGLILGVFVFGVNTTKDLGDYEADKQAGIRNFVTVMGIQGAIQNIIIPFLYIPFLLWVIYITVFGHLAQWQFYMPILALPLSLISHRTLMRRVVVLHENHISWYIFYAEMAVLIILFVLPQL